MNWINPAREIKDKYIILYATQEGGEFHTIGFKNDKETKAKFYQAIEDGFIKLKTGDFDPLPIDLAFIALVKIEKNWDFVLQKWNKKQSYD